MFQKLSFMMQNKAFLACPSGLSWAACPTRAVLALICHFYGDYNYTKLIRIVQ
jgi:hypothetical protein